MSDDLDALIHAPLPEEADGGFSHRVEQRIDAERLRAARRKTFVERGLIALALLIVPFTPAGAALGAMMDGLGGALISSEAFTIVLASLLLAFVALQFTRDEN